MALNQQHFRFGINELAESTHGWHAAEDVSITSATVGLDTTFLLRFGIFATAVHNNIDFTFQYRLNNGTWTSITTTSTVAVAVNGILTNGGNCTQRLTGQGTFQGLTGQTEDGTSGGNSMDIPNGGCAETEIAIQILSANVAPGDVVEFRLLQEAAVMSAYNVTPFYEVPSAGSPSKRTAQPTHFPRPSHTLAALTIASTLLQSTLAPAAAAGRDTYEHETLLRPAPSVYWDPPPNLLTGPLGIVEAPFSQTDWPAPARAGNPPPIETLPSLLIGPLAVPFSQADWPAPLRALPPPPPESLPSLLDTTLAVSAAPFAQTEWPLPGSRPWVDGSWAAHRGLYLEDEPAVVQTDWPNPITRPVLIWLDLPSLLETTLAPAAEPGVPFAQTDWPIPVIRPPVLDLTIETRPGESPAPAAAPFVPTVWPEPTGLRQPPLVEVPNLLLTTLAPAPAAGDPFVQTDWPVVRPRVPQQGFIGYYALDDTVPFHETEWPLPRRATAPALSWTQALVTDTTPPVQPPPPLDWPVPAPVRRPVEQWTVSRWIGLEDEFPPLVADWPVPAPLRRPVEQWTLERWIGLTEPPSVAPFALTEWPVPLAPQRPSEHWEAARWIGLTEPPAAAPFLPIDWPVPTAVRRPTEDWTASRWIGLVEPETPLLPVDWPLPVVIPRPITDWTASRWIGLVDERLPSDAVWPPPWAPIRPIVADPPNLLTSTLAPPPVPLPVGQGVWEVPAPRVGDRGAVWGSSLAQLVPPPDPATFVAALASAQPLLPRRPASSAQGLAAPPYNTEIFPIPDVLAGLTFLPGFPDRVLHVVTTREQLAPTLPLEAAVAVQPVAWHPTFPDRVPPVRLPLAAYPVAADPPPGTQVVIGQGRGWAGGYPDRVPHHVPPLPPAPPWSVDPTLLTVPCVEFGLEETTTTDLIGETLTSPAIVEEGLGSPAIITEDLC